MHFACELRGSLGWTILALWSLQVNTNPFNNGINSFDQCYYSDYARIYKILSSYVESKLPGTLNKVLDYLTSPGAVLPLLLLLVLFIYYLISTVSSLKDSNKELKSQIRKDKDGSEATNLGMAPTPGIVEQPGITTKHVRIQEDEPKLDKTNLVESCDTSVLSA